MSTNATLGNATHLLTLAGQKNLSKEGCDALVQTGLLADLIEAAEAGNLTSVDRAKFRRLIGFDDDILHRLFADEEIALDPTEGAETIVKAGDTFTGYLDPDYENWGTNQSSVPTAVTPVEVRELVKDATFAQMFGSLNRPLDELCLTQGQIIGFCRKHRAKLRSDGYATFFLFKVGVEYFVALVHVGGDGQLSARVGRLSRDLVWYGVNRHRVVLPQQKL